jgi:hypothetical protein
VTETPSEDIDQDPGIPGAPRARTADEAPPPEVDDIAARPDDPDDEGHRSAS